MFGALAMSGYQRRHRFLAGQRGLQERTRRQDDARGADLDCRRRPHQHQFAMAGQPGQAVPLGDLGQACDQRGRQRPRATHIDIEAIAGRCDLDIQRFGGGLQGFSQRPRGVERAAQARIEDRTFRYRDDGMAVGGGESGAQFAIAAAAGVDGDAAAAGAVGVDQRRDLAFDTGMTQRIDHDLAFPRPIGLRLPVLDGAAAAGAEISAERIDPVRARVLDAHQRPAIGMIGDGFDLDGFSRQRVRHEQALAAGKADAVAAMTDMVDDETFSHGARR